MFGVTFVMFRRSTAPISRNSSPLTAVTETGVSCRFSVVRRAVVMTSSSVPDGVCAPTDMDNPTVRPTATGKDRIRMAPPTIYTST